MKLLWEESAWEDYCYWQAQDKKTIKKINLLIKDIQRNFFERDRKARTIKRKFSSGTGAEELMKRIEWYTQ